MNSASFSQRALLHVYNNPHEFFESISIYIIGMSSKKRYTYADIAECS